MEKNTVLSGKMKKVILILISILFISCTHDIDYQHKMVQERLNVKPSQVTLITENNFVVKSDSAYFHVKLFAVSKKMTVREISIE